MTAERKRSFVFFLIILFLYLCISWEMHVFAAEDTGSKHITVLVDTSRSIKDNEWHELAYEWVREICALCVDTEIGLSIIAFDDADCKTGGGFLEIFKADVIDEKALADIDAAIRNIKREGNYTNQYDAMVLAQNELDRSDASTKTIIMLTDGILDLDNKFTKDHEPVFNDEEIEKISMFREHCAKMAENGYRLFLVNFDTKKDGYGADLLKGIKGTEYFSKESDHWELIKLLYKNNDYTLDSQEGAMTNGKSTFTLEKDYYRTIIKVRRDENNALEGKNILLCNSKENLSLEPIKVYDLSNSSYIYFAGLSKGKYELQIDGTLQDYITIWNMLKRAALELQITVKNEKDGTALTENEDSSYQVTREDTEFWVEVQINGNVENDEIEEITCQMEGGEKVSIDYPSERGVMMKVPDAEGKDEYVCTVRIRMQSGMEMERSVKFIYDNLRLAQESHSININEIYNLLEGELSENGYYKDFFRYQVYDKEKKVEIGEEYYNIDCSEGNICFKKKGQYVVEVLYNDKVVKDIIFDVSDGEKGNNGCIIVAVIIFAIIFVVLVYAVYKTRKNKRLC